MNNFTSPLYHPEQQSSDPLPDIGSDVPDAPVAPPVDGDEHSEPDLPGIGDEPDLPQEEEPPPAGPPGFFDPGKMLADLDTAHKDATRRNQLDWADKPSQQATNQHFIDMRFGQRKREIGELRDQLGAYLADWLGTPQPDGEPRTHRPPFRIWTMLSHDQRRAVDGFLARNAGASLEFTYRWVEAEREGRLAKLNSQSIAGDQPSKDPFLIDVDVRDNARQGAAAVEEYLARIDPTATFKEQIRIYAKGVPGYMVADVLITGGGVTHLAITELHIVEVKSGAATLSKSQLAMLSKAIQGGEVYIVNGKAGEQLGNIKPHLTLAEQRILPIVSVIGGDQEGIKRQFRDFGIEYMPSGGGRLGRSRGGGLVE